MNGNDGLEILKTLPLEDDRIDQALVELDMKLDAWAEMIITTETRLKNLASSLKTQESDKIETQASGDETSVADTTSVYRETENETVSLIEKAEKPEQPQIKNEVTDEPVLVEESAKDNTDQEDEESLLATLEPELVKKIQVLRRLTNKKRPIRELIEQVKSGASTSASEVEPKKKSFWRR